MMPNRNRGLDMDLAGGVIDQNQTCGLAKLLLINRGDPCERGFCQFELNVSARQTVALRLQRFDSLRPWRHRFLASRSVIHVVEDDQAMRDSLVELLEDAGYTVRAYTRAEELLARDAAIEFRLHSQRRAHAGHGRSHPAAASSGQRLDSAADVDHWSRRRIDGGRCYEGWRCGFSGKAV